MYVPEIMTASKNITDEPMHLPNRSDASNSIFGSGDCSNHSNINCQHPTNNIVHEPRMMTLYMSFQNVTYHMTISYKKGWIYRALACYYDEKNCVLREHVHYRDLPIDH